MRTMWITGSRTRVLEPGVRIRTNYKILKEEMARMSWWWWDLYGRSCAKHQRQLSIKDKGFDLPKQLLETRSRFTFQHFYKMPSLEVDDYLADEYIIICKVYTTVNSSTFEGIIKISGSTTKI